MAQSDSSSQRTLRVGVLVDWKRSSRTSAWQPVLERMADRNLPLYVTEYRVADLIVANPDGSKPTGLGAIASEDVLIVNWDAANGDPEFGAHLLMAWLRHRRPEILLWLRRGNVLIIESQATFGVPTRDAYDAAVGRDELPTCGLPDPLQPLTFKKRVGAKCVKSAAFPVSNGFGNVDSPLEVHSANQPDKMFPASATRLLTTELHDFHWEDALYRGWFRRRLLRSPELPWVTLVTTATKPKHSTLEAAKIDRGTIFATTMMLANTGQDRLIEAMLRCAHGNDHLPKPTEWIGTFRKWWMTILTVISGSAVTWFLAGPGKIIGSALTTLQLPTDFILSKDLLKWGFVFGGGLAIGVVRHCLAGIRRSIRDYLGY
ncbi:hypothetical protein [Caballeronia sp. GAFFF1]|uniref:hypothetical protein n=1 Tax=Caballeronia sp. GAFFF1 TaxID=2921779 RepID=UPI0020280A43|nr:hypothetical protein [Caballeronia sp. GAFFF1]